jgi:rhodanese-related sulfurtransferase/transcriptional regulator with XRE-family HTH domain
VIRTVSVKEAQALMASGELDVVDVRDSNEWATGHVPGARHVPLGDIKDDTKKHLPRDKVLLICAKGGRSMTAAKLAEAIGLQEVYSMDGGTLGWAQAGLPIEVPAKAAAPASERPAASVKSAPTAEEEIGLDGIVGTNLRELRAKRGLTLDVLAKMTGLSRALLGQIEIGRSAPSVSVVWKVARAFDVPFSALLAAPGNVETKLLPNATAKRLVSPDGRYSSRALFPFGEQQQVEFYELWLAAHAREDAEAHAPGTRENLVVVTGRLEVLVGTERYQLAKGDAIVFGADVTHSYINPGSEECLMHLVMTYANK